MEVLLAAPRALYDFQVSFEIVVHISFAVLTSAHQRATEMRPAP